MKKIKLLPPVIAIIAVIIAGAGIFACAQAIQTHNTKKEYEQKFAQTLQKMEKMEDEEFGTIEFPFFLETQTRLIPNYNIDSPKFQEISAELESLRTKISADIYADAFLNYDLKEMAQCFLANIVFENCYTDDTTSSDPSDSRTDFAKNGDSFFKMLASDKVSDEAKEAILMHMEPSEKNKEKWDKYKLDVLSKSKTLADFEYRMTTFFSSVFDVTYAQYYEAPGSSITEENVSPNPITEEDIIQKEAVLKKCREWIDNPDDISNAAYIGSIEAILNYDYENLSESEHDELYKLVRLKLSELYETKNGKEALLANDTIFMLYNLGSWENMTFLKSLSEQLNSDSSLYSIMLSSSMCKALYTVHTESPDILISQLKNEPSLEHINIALEFINSSYQYKALTGSLSETSMSSIYSYLDSIIKKLPPEQQPQLKKVKQENSSDGLTMTTTIDLDNDGMDDNETCCFDTPSYYEVSFACGDKLSYHFQDETNMTNICTTQMHDINGDGKKEFIILGYQLNNNETIITPRCFCLVMQKKDGSNTYTVVPTKSGEDCYFFEPDNENNKDGYDDKWISQLDFS